MSGESKGARVASGDLKMRCILKRLPSQQARAAPFGTRLCLQSLVCYTLVPADAEKGLRADAASTCSAAEGCMAVDSLRPPSAGLQRNQWCTFSHPAAAAFFLSGRNCVNLTRFHFTVSGAFSRAVVCPCSFAPHAPAA